MTSGQPAPGWYPDPTGQPGQKYWDGGQWSAESAPPSQGVAPYGGAPYGGAPYGGAPFGVDANGNPLSDKSKLVAGLLQIFVSTFAVGRFYLGYTNLAIIQVVVVFCTCGVGALWPLIDGIMILMGSVPDPQGRTLRD